MWILIYDCSILRKHRPRAVVLLSPGPRAASKRKIMLINGKKGRDFFFPRASALVPRGFAARPGPHACSPSTVIQKKKGKCSQSKENETRKSSSMKEQYPGYQRFFLACGDFSGSATTKVWLRRYLGAFQASEGKRQASKERPTRATGEGAERWKSTNNGVWTGVSFSAPSHERQSFSPESLKIETGNPAWEVSATQGKHRVEKRLLLSESV